MHIPIRLYKEDKVVHQIGMTRAMGHDDAVIDAGSLLNEYLKELNAMSEDKRKVYNVPEEFDLVEIELGGIDYKFPVVIQDKVVKKAPRSK